MQRQAAIHNRLRRLGWSVMDWGCESIHLDAFLELMRLRFTSRLTRFVARLRSPRHMAANFAMLAFVMAYFLVGLTILSQRPPADLERLKLWLSGGMILYALYHGLKELWSATPGGANDERSAEALWLDGGPVRRGVLVIREVMTVLPAATAKTVMLAVLLFRDVPSIVLLATGVWLALVTLEVIRRLISVAISGLAPVEIRLLRIVSVACVTSVAIQIGCGVILNLPQSVDPLLVTLATMRGVGDLAGSTSIQVFAWPLQAASDLAVTGAGISKIMALAGVSVASLGVMAALLLRVDAWSSARRLRYERTLLQRWWDRQRGVVPEKLDSIHLSGASVSFWIRTSWDRFLFSSGGLVGSVLSITSRQWVCLHRYRWNVFFSFLIPTVLSLSPLLTDRGAKGWVFVIGGIALCSILLAPPSLRIDFRRDLRRMLLLRSLPISSLAMCLGMISLPVVVTIVFQWFTLGMATSFTDRPQSQLVWLALCFPALSVITFAIENALFLTFPHQVTDQGIAMVVRAKMTFAWKAILLVLCPVGVMACSAIVHAVFSGMIATWVTLVVTCGMIWFIAAGSVWLLVRTWDRFDPIFDPV